MKTRPLQEKSTGAALVIIGLGNIGSQFVPLIAFHSALQRIVLVDKDIYEASNLAGQSITRSDFGRAKAEVQAARLRRLNPRLEVTAIFEDVARIAPGNLRASLIVACVDSLEARIGINQLAWHLGVPWLDGGVEPGHRLVRVSAYAPQPQNPCFECALADRDYSQLGSSLSCQPQGRSAPPTNGPASLGAMAAALLAVECDKLLSGRCETSLFNKQLIVDTEHHVQLMNLLHRNDRCRFGHVIWQMSRIKALVPQLTVKQALGMTCRLAGPDVSLSIPGGSFTKALRCPRCGKVRHGFHLLGRLPRSHQNCSRCGGSLLASGIDLVPSLNAELSAQILNTSLQRLGIHSGDIFEVLGSENTFRCEVVSDAESHGENSIRNRATLRRKRNLACEVESEPKPPGKPV